MLNEVFIPDENHHSIELPKEFYGKKVQVIAFEINDAAPKAIQNEGSFWDDIDYNPDFPSIEEIRKIVWPSNEKV